MLLELKELEERLFLAFDLQRDRDFHLCRSTCTCTEVTKILIVIVVYLPTLTHYT